MQVKEKAEHGGDGAMDIDALSRHARTAMKYLHVITYYPQNNLEPLE